MCTMFEKHPVESVDKSQSLERAVTVAFPEHASISPSILPQAVGRQDSTSCPFISCYSGPLLCALCGGVRGSKGEEEEREGPPWGHPSPLILPLITFLTVSLRLNNNRGSSLAASLCVLIMFTGEIITQAGRRAD